MKQTAIIAAIVASLGILDVVFRGLITGQKYAIEYSLHDPGKIFFHILMLPVAVAIL